MKTTLTRAMLGLSLIIFSFAAVQANAGKAPTRDSSVTLPYGERSIMSDRAINERTMSDTQVCFEGDSCADPSTMTASASSSDEPRTAESLYQSYCSACHASGVGGAPKTHDAGAWSGRKNLATAISGIGIMPARGGCADCSDDELQSIIDFMSQ